MTKLLDKKTKQEKIIEKRNLFGLGLTSLIAACSAAENATENNAVGIGTRPETDLEAEQLDAAHTIKNSDIATISSNEAGGLPARNTNTGSAQAAILDVQVTVTYEQAGFSDANPLILRIANGNHDTGTRIASVYTGLAATDQHDLVVSSYKFGEVDGSNLTGAIYIFWNIGNIDPTEIPTNDAAAKTLALNHLRVEGSDVNYTISSSSPKFYHIGGDADQYDMVFRSGTGFNIAWDVTQHATKEGETTVTLGASPGILQITNTGEIPPEFTKINNNKDYDMIVKQSATTHILWDVANYYDANAEAAIPVVDLTDVNAVTHGLLTIKGLAGVNIMTATMGNDEVGYTDIDEGGINDLAFVYNNNTYILFGEKVANRDGEKAISHTVDLDAVAMGDFYDKKAGDDRAMVDKATTGGFFDYGLDGNDTIDDVEKNVGYRLIGDASDLIDIATKYEAAINPSEGTPALSEEAYWDIA